MIFKHTILAAAIGALATGAAASAAVIDFNTPGDLTTHFNLPAGDTVGQTHIEADSGGVGNSRAVRPSDNDRTAVYKTESFDLEIGQTFTTSMILKKTTVSAGNSRALQIGLGGGTADIFTTPAIPFLSARVDTTPSGGQFVIRVQHRNREQGISTTDASSAFDLVSDRMYRFTVTIERTAADTYQVGGSLLDYGIDGLTPGNAVANFDTKTVTNDILTGATPPDLYAGFRSMYPAGALRLDNFTAEVPEPAGAGLILLPAIALLTRQRSAR